MMWQIYYIMWHSTSYHAPWMFSHDWWLNLHIKGYTIGLRKEKYAASFLTVHMFQLSYVSNGFSI